MKAFILFGVAGLSLSACAAPKLPEKYRLDAETVFAPLSKSDATQLGRRMARTDFSASVFRLLIYGEPGPLFPSEIYLAKRYKVYSIRIAGCEITESILSGAESYNKEMRRLLTVHFAKDVFAEASTKDTEQDAAANP